MSSRYINKPNTIICDVNKFLSKLHKKPDLQWSEKVALKQLNRELERKLKD